MELRKQHPVRDSGSVIHGAHPHSSHYSVLDALDDDGPESSAETGEDNVGEGETATLETRYGVDPADEDTVLTPFITQELTAATETAIPISQRKLTVTRVARPSVLDRGSSGAETGGAAVQQQPKPPDMPRPSPGPKRLSAFGSTISQAVDAGKRRTIRFQADSEETVEEEQDKELKPVLSSDNSDGESVNSAKKGRGRNRPNPRYSGGMKSPVYLSPDPTSPTAATATKAPAHRDTVREMHDMLSLLNEAATDVLRHQKSGTEPSSPGEIDERVLSPVEDLEEDPEPIPRGKRFSSPKPYVVPPSADEEYSYRFEDSEG